MLPCLADRRLAPCVLYGSRTIPIVLLDTSGWSPGTVLAWMLCPGSRKLQLWPGKSTKWADYSHSTQRTPHSCTFFHCQGRRRSERGRRERKAEQGTVGGIWTGPASKTQGVVFFRREKDSSWTPQSVLGCVWAAGNHTKSLSVVVLE